MAEPFLGEIKMFGGNFAPRGYAFCNGQLLAIAQNTALFSILGTTYGGNGQTTFGLPDLRGRAPLHQGQGPGLSNYTLGEMAGDPTVTLISNEMPAHTHTPGCQTGAGNVGSPIGAVWAQGVGRSPPPLYSSTAPNTSMSANAIGLTGGNQPHNNAQPSLAVTFIIATQGIFPARN